MHRMIRTHQCNDNELAAIELAWMIEGYRRVEKASASDLLPFEYMRTTSQGTQHTFFGPTVHTLQRREQ